MHGGFTAAGGRAVHDVVVEESECMQKFERSAGVDDLLGIGVAANANKTPVAKCWAQSLTAAEHESANSNERIGQGGVER